MKRYALIFTLLLVNTLLWGQNPVTADTILNDTVFKSKVTVPADEYAIPNRVTEKYVNRVNPDETCRMLKSGIMIIGTGKDVRAAESYGGRNAGEKEYAESANKYKRVFGDSVNVYCMVIPSAAAFYTPNKLSGSTRHQGKTIDRIFSYLSDSVKAVDVYTILGRHASEKIYSRTDHHWAPLGAYYAAKKFAAVAGVPFKDLSWYTKHTVKNYVGTMYMFSKQKEVKDAPEDFIYYTPDSIQYTTTYTNYVTRKGVAVAEGKTVKGTFFQPVKDGSTGAYCVFMGGDAKITKVETSTKNGRRLVIFKESYGNAIPGYLFYSFEEIHVIDCRYFKKNIKKYVRDNHITDILFANNIARAVLNGTNRSYLRFLTQ